MFRCVLKLEICNFKLNRWLFNSTSEILILPHVWTQLYIIQNSDPYIWKHCLLYWLAKFHIKCLHLSFLNGKFKLGPKFPIAKREFIDVLNVLCVDAEIMQISCSDIHTVKATVFGTLNSALSNFQTWFVRTVMEVLKYCWMQETSNIQCNYNSFIQIINFHGLFRNALRCRKTGACRILVPLQYIKVPIYNMYLMQLGNGTT